MKAITHIPGYTELFSGPQDTIDTVAAAYAKVPLIFRAVHLRADALSQVPVSVVKGETEAEWPFEAPLSDLLWKTEAALLMYGAAYWLRLNNLTRKGLGMSAQNVICLNPESIEMDWKENQAIFFQPALGNGPWTMDEVVYFREFDPSQDVHPGIGAAMASLGDAQLANYAIRMVGKYFEGGAMPAMIVGMENSTDEEVKRTEGWFNRRLGGIQAGVKRTLGLNKLPEIHNITSDLKNMVVPEVYELAKMNIATSFGIPPTMLEDPAANRATAEVHRVSFWADTVRPNGNRVLGEINRQLLAPMGLEMQFNWEELDVFQEDEEQRAGSLLQLTQAGVPVEAGMSILGYDLSEEQEALMVVEEEDDGVGLDKNAPEIFGYHIDAGVVEKDEVRERLGLAPTGDTGEKERAELMAKLKVMQAAVMAGIDPQTAMTMAGITGKARDTAPLIMTERSMPYDMASELMTWEKHVKGNLKKGRPALSDFQTEHISESLRAAIMGALEYVETDEDAHVTFRSVHAGYP